MATVYAIVVRYMYWYNAVINLSLLTDWSSCHVPDPINYWKVKLQRRHQRHHQRMTLLVTSTNDMHITQIDCTFMKFHSFLYNYMSVLAIYWVASYSYVSIYVRICTHACEYVYPCVYAYSYACVFTCIHVNIQTCTY